MNGISQHKIIHTYEYDRLADSLYILIEPFRGWSFYQSIADQPGLMRRFRVDDESLVGFTVQNVSARLSPEPANDDTLRSLATRIVDQYA